VTYRFLETPVGGLLLGRDEAGLRLIRFAARADLKVGPYDSSDKVGPYDTYDKVGPYDRVGPYDDRAFDDVTSQLTEYFAGTRRQFDLPLAPEGTPFQQRVWRVLLDIPYGQTISYGELAARIGQPSAARAVGLANGSNPLPIVIPCHRVIGAGGKLTGYGGGLPIKRQLLALERGVLW
jgi:methylated-DNA-[protein]-cysteine S-methyltransferase